MKGEPHNCPPQNCPLGGQSWGGQFWVHQSSELPTPTNICMIYALNGPWVSAVSNNFFDLGDISMNWYNLCHTQTDIDKYVQVVPKLKLCFFRWSLKLAAREDAKSLWLHLLDFSPLYVFKCLLKLLGSEQAYSHWLHFLVFSPLFFQMSPIL